MKSSTLRTLIILFTMITAVIHLVLGLGSLGDGFFGVLFILNAIGFLVLLVALLRPFAFLEGQEKLVHYGFMAFAAVTIIAWLVLSGDFTAALDVVTKIDELLLIVVLWLHLQASTSG
jgi:hypothetical protein